MKVVEILREEMEVSGTGIGVTQGGEIPYNSKRDEAHPEIAELLNARLTDTLFNSRALARDEIELANFIINKLDADPNYVPSEMLLQVIRNICDKRGDESSLHGVIRTA
jgi:hypothetical protein